MTTQEINNQRNSNGVYSVSNTAWYAISRDGINMITFYEGKFNFTAKSDVNKVYTDKGFANRVTQLLNRGY